MHPTTFFVEKNVYPLKDLKLFSKETTRLSQNETFSHLLLGTVILFLV